MKIFILNRPEHKDLYGDCIDGTLNYKIWYVSDDSVYFVPIEDGDYVGRSVVIKTEDMNIFNVFDTREATLEDTKCSEHYKG